MAFLRSLPTFALIGSCAIACSANPVKGDPTAAEPLRAPSAENAVAQIEEIQKRSEMPGLRVVVTDSGQRRIDYARGLRALERNVSVQPNDKWHVGSCGKPMTAFVVGRMIDRGALRWSSTLQELVPKRVKLHPSLKAVTLEMLLSHRGGIADMITVGDGKVWPLLWDENLDPREGREMLAKALLAEKPSFTPGSKTEYSNSGYVLLGWLLEQRSKMKWESLVARELFGPLGMRSCGFGPQARFGQDPPDQPWGHLIHEGKLTPVPAGPGADNPPTISPAGTIHCNPDDLVRFLSMVSDGFNKKSTYVKPATFEKLLSKASPDSFFTYSSFGTFERDWAKGTAFLIEGNNTMNHAIIATAPQRERHMMILTNSGTPKAVEGSGEILKLLTTLP